MASDSSSSETTSSYYDSSDEELDLCSAGTAQMGVKPYMFEPPPPPPKSKTDTSTGSSATQDTTNQPSTSDHEPHVDRIGTSNWCTCGTCVPREDAATSFCCRESAELNVVREEEEELACCTQHSGIQAVTTNVHVLKAAYNSNRTKYGQRRRQHRGPWTENEKYRHVAYGNIVALAWGYLGRKHRVPLPSCVMKMITDKFPSAHYTGYQEAEDSD